MSEYENCRRKVKALQLSREQARSVADSAFRADLASGLPHMALKCAREFELGDARVNEAASSLVSLLVSKGRLSDAVEVARGFNLAAGDENIQARLVEDTRRIDVSTLDDAQRATLVELKRLAGEAASKRARRLSADDALAVIRRATEARGDDRRVRGRAVFIEGRGDLFLTGDLHGNVENLRRFAEAAALDRHPERIMLLQEIVHSRIITADQRDLSFVAIIEALKLVAAYPGRVYYMLGNHDLAFGCNRELVKGGKFLNRFLYKGLAYMYQSRHEEVAEAYKKFIQDMPAALICANGVFLSHSSPKKPFIPSISIEYLTKSLSQLPLAKCGPIKAMTEGRDFAEATIEEFTTRMGADLVVCGHTPTPKGYRKANSRQLIIDSQHENGKYLNFDLGRRYTVDELVPQVKPLLPDTTSDDLVGELM